MTHMRVTSFRIAKVKYTVLVVEGVDPPRLEIEIARAADPSRCRVIQWYWYRRVVTIGLDITRSIAEHLKGFRRVVHRMVQDLSWAESSFWTNFMRNIFHLTEFFHLQSLNGNDNVREWSYAIKHWARANRTFTQMTVASSLHCREQCIENVLYVLYFSLNRYIGNLK